MFVSKNKKQEKLSTHNSNNYVSGNLARERERESRNPSSKHFTFLLQQSPNFLHTNSFVLEPFFSFFFFRKNYSLNWRFLWQNGSDHSHPFVISGQIAPKALTFLPSTIDQIANGTLSSKQNNSNFIILAINKLQQTKGSEC